MFVKVCGITSEEDGLLAVALDADALGFVFAPSPRQVRPQQVREIVHRLPSEVMTIGVFRDERREHVVEVASRIGLAGVQLHGHESDDDAAWIRERVPFLIRAFAAGSPELRAAAQGPADAILVDSPQPGSGKVFDWSLAEGAPSGVRLVLAGGLTPENVGEAIRRVRPWGVDVATGVEREPGLKDAQKLRRFVLAARDAFTEIEDRLPGAEEADERPFDWRFDA